jgi:hypothetical protein
MARKFPVVLMLSLVTLAVLAVSCNANSLQDNDLNHGDYKHLEPAIQTWIDSSKDELAEDIGNRITDEMPVLSGIASEVIKKVADVFISGLMEGEITTSENTDNTNDDCTARIRFYFPIDIDVEVMKNKITKESSVTVDYLVQMRDNTVVDSRIDLESLKMETLP